MTSYVFYVRTAASGKYHGLSIVKNAERRSKMDLMFLEQVKMQRKQETGLERRKEIKVDWRC